MDREKKVQIFASVSLFTRIFGDSPTDIVVNTIVLATLAYVLWRYLLSPLSNLLQNCLELFRKREIECLEITPPVNNDVDPEHTQSFLNVILGQHQRQRLSLEIVSDKKNGIRYQIVAEAHAINNIKKQISAYLPDVKVKKSKGAKAKTSSIIYTFKQQRHFAFPLKTYVTNQNSDPIAFIVGTLTRLDEKDQLTMQLVVRPYSSRQASSIYNRILKNGRTHIGGGLGYYIKAYSWAWLPATLIAYLFRNWALGIVAAVFIWIVGTFSGEKEAERPLTITEEKVYEDVIAKLDQPLARVAMRLSVDSSQHRFELLDGFRNSLKTLDRPGFQSLNLSRQVPGKRWQALLAKLYRERLSSVFSRNSLILGNSELASLYHFPYGSVKTEDMVRSHSRTLPAPLSLKGNPKLDIEIGVNKYQGEETPIGLTTAERERHMYVIGGTGSGKTTMLKYQIVQDMRNGKGVAIVDPHGDLAEELLEFVPKERKKDLIYLNPDDLDHPLGVNLLELPEGLSGNDLLREKDRVTESVISVMRKVFSDDDSGGHRIEYVLRNTIHTAFTTENPTLFTIFRLLNDGKYAKSVIKNLDDQDLKAFWKNELGKAGSMQKVKMSAGITAKIGRFLFSASARAMLEKEKSDIDFTEVLDGKILICNFSKGKLGEDTSSLFGTTILAKLQLAALKRSEKKQSDRKPFYLYVDEFQNFATMSFTQMLSEARKYKLYLVMAEQSTQQQADQKMIEVILANVGTIVVFRTGSPRDEELMLPRFEPYIEKGEMSNLPAYNFYCRISGKETSEPTSGETVLVD